MIKWWTFLLAHSRFYPFKWSFKWLLQVDSLIKENQDKLLKFTAFCVFLLKHYIALHLHIKEHYICILQLQVLLQY